RTFRCCLKPFVTPPIHKFANRGIVNTLENLRGESADEDASRSAVADATRPQIKKRFLVQPSDAGAVSAANIVGPDFELWFGVDLGVFRKKQVLTVLHSIGLLGLFSNDNRAIENSFGAPREYSFV